MSEITINCPDCGRTMSIERQPEDPPSAASMKMQCDRCSDGDWHSPEYFDAAGKWVNPVEHLSTHQEQSNG